MQSSSGGLLGAQPQWLVAAGPGEERQPSAQPRGGRKGGPTDWGMRKPESRFQKEKKKEVNRLETATEGVSIAFCGSKIRRPSGLACGWAAATGQRRYQ